MGNIEEKQSKETKLQLEAIPPVQIISNESTENKENEPVVIPQKSIAKPLFKASFYKILPIVHVSAIESTEDVEEMVEKQQQEQPAELPQPSTEQKIPVPNDKKVKPRQRRSLLENIIFSTEKLRGKVEVNWNSFFKIKQKSYLQQYTYCKQIGKGSFGTVIKAKMKFGSHFRAIKIIKQSASLEKQSNKLKVYSELSIPIELDHPNIVKIFQVFEWKQSLGIVMQLCEGGDLFTFIKNQRKFTENIAAGIFKQIISGVLYMHKHNVCHRDLKPQNMLYDNEGGLVKIIDFGTATKFTRGKSLNQIMGTPFYMAPQVIGGKYNEKCDVWSCGIILYIMLSGFPPFQGKNQKQIFQRIQTVPISFTQPIWAKRTPQVKQLLQGMLCKDPKNRMTAEQVLNSPWLDRNMKVSTTDNTQIGSQIINNLKNFHFKNKLKAVVYTFIASQLYENKDKQNLLLAFREIDKDGDGVIERNQLIQTFNEHTQLSLQQIENILKIIDTNSSGRIDFTQFLVAASNEEQLLKKKQLENAFSYLDTDHSGYITIQEVKAFLDGSEQTTQQIKQIFQQVDQNGDGQISKSQFISLLISKT